MKPGAELLHLYVSPGHNFFGHTGRPPGTHSMLECSEVRCVAGRGLEGDRFFDFKRDYNGQITFFEMEVYDAVCAEFCVWDRPPSVFRRNVITRGINLQALIGCEFEIQGVRFAGTDSCQPCHWMEQAFHRGAEASLKNRGGLRAKILKGGLLRVGPARLVA